MNRIMSVVACVAALSLAACDLQTDNAWAEAPALSGQQVANPILTPTPDLSMCQLNFTNPAADAALSAYGPVEFAWTLTAAPWITNKLPFDVFSLVVAYPGGNPLVHYETAAEHKTLYMENFQTGGTYTVTVSALDQQDNVLCWDQLKFSKDDYVPVIQLTPQPLPQPPQSVCPAGRCP